MNKTISEEISSRETVTQENGIEEGREGVGRIYLSFLSGISVLS